MRWKSFAPEEVVSLRSNPYTAKVTEKTITFTLAFKEAFWKGLQEGRTASSLIQDLGYDLEILGETRISGIAYHIKEEAKSPDGLHEGRRKRATRSLSEEELATMSQTQSMRRLQSELAYLRQEMEFLKKIIQSGNGKRQEK